MDEKEGCNLLSHLSPGIVLPDQQNYWEGSGFSEKNSRWRKLSGNFFQHGSNGTSKIRPASGGEDLPVQVTLTQSKDKKNSFLVVCVWLLITHHLAERTRLIEKKLIYLLKIVDSFLHWSCFYCFLRDFTILKVGKLNFSGARCEVLSMNILCASALLENFIYTFSIQLQTASETVSYELTIQILGRVSWCVCIGRNRGQPEWLSLASYSSVKPYGKGKEELFRDSTESTASQHPSLLALRVDLEQTFLFQTNPIQSVNNVNLIIWGATWARHIMCQQCTYGVANELNMIMCPLVPRSGAWRLG